MVKIFAKALEWVPHFFSYIFIWNRSMIFHYSLVNADSSLALFKAIVIIEFC